MKIVLTQEAKADLEDLREFLSPLSPVGLANVAEAIEKKILLAAENPTMGKPSPRNGVREVIETKYGFLIPYFVKDNLFYVLRVYRSMREPLDYDTVDVPK